jgi:hypothetical protein
MTCFTALCQYMCRKTPSRSHTALHCTCSTVLAYKFYHSSSTTKIKVVTVRAVKVYESVKVKLHPLVALAEEGGEYKIRINI